MADLVSYLSHFPIFQMGLGQTIAVLTRAATCHLIQETRRENLRVRPFRPNYYTFYTTRLVVTDLSDGHVEVAPFPLSKNCNSSMQSCKGALEVDELQEEVFDALRHVLVAFHFNSFERVEPPDWPILSRMPV